MLTDPEQIASLGHADRLAILGELVDEARTGSQVAERLGLPVQRTHYHLGRLVKDGLVVEVGLADKRFKQERFYRAAARHHLVYPAHGATDEATSRAVLEAFERVFDVWRRRELLDIDLAAVARRVVDDVLRVRPGDRVLVMGPPQVREIQDAIFLAVEMRGGRPSLRTWSREYIYSRLDLMKDEATRSLPFVSDADTDDLAGFVFVTSTQPAGPEPNERQRDNLPRLLEALTTWQRRLRTLGVRQVELSVPVRGDVEDGELSVEEALATFWRALSTDSDVLSARVDALLARIDGREDLALIDDVGGRLDLRVDAARPHLNIGRLSDADLAKGHAFEEFPPGSLTLLAVPGKASGELTFPYVSVGGRRVRDVTVRVHEGRIANIEAPEHAEFLRERIARAVGDADSVAEVRLGVNPAGDALTGKASLDAVLDGTVTLAFGSNETLGGSQSATLDLRLPSRSLEVRAGDDVVAARP
ncbi:MAG: helix-turn-helix domain-containing protein [Planctomycetota bacterium]